ncbi:membrane-associated tyrosine- and threonine-specific cdc2-inhibitory kinase-like [Diabrotica virgifera virgifera]|uniref:non-specific serine/threonine protein kinase n=1 Tax=Diabrotica virgifera virgifera TaxID=50390 RepID=A0ABM5JHF3_DIAVI|nr:membrane-associated tyrosine- and threonine-specific cdc2-inhibitory kinase-like [Diabrotica virgifera virgifera]
MLASVDIVLEEQRDDQKKDVQKEDLPSIPSYHTRSIARARQARALFVYVTVDLDIHYNPLLEPSYYQQIYTSPVKVGEGSFGQVFKARNRFTNIKYAIKEFRRGISTKIKYAEISNNEKVGIHPNCVKFYMAWEQCAEVYMVLEACQMSLSDFVKKYTIKENTLWDCLLDICKALNYLHGKSLIHRDVKASNIMLYGTSFKLADFGTLVDLNTPPDSTDISPNLLAKLKPSRDILELGLAFSRLVSGVSWSSPITDAALDTSPKSNHSAELKQYAASFQTVIKRMIAVDYLLPPTAAEVLEFDELKDAIERWNKNLRTVYTTENLADLEEKFFVSAERWAQDDTASNPQRDASQLLNLPHCSRTLK